MRMSRNRAPNPNDLKPMLTIVSDQFSSVGPLMWKQVEHALHRNPLLVSTSLVNSLFGAAVPQLIQGPMRHCRTIGNGVLSHQLAVLHHLKVPLVMIRS